MPTWMGRRIALDGQLHFSQPSHAPSDRDGTRFLRPRGRPYTVFGQAHLKLELDASLSTVNYEAGNTAPALGYTGAYAFANVLLTVAGAAMMRA